MNCNMDLSLLGRASSVAERERIIQFVRQYPCLYNPSHPEYILHGLTDPLWRKISAELNLPDSQARKIWKNLRDSYRSQVRKNAASFEIHGQVLRKKWIFFDAMAFMKPFMKWLNIPEAHPAFRPSPPPMIKSEPIEPEDQPPPIYYENTEPPTPHFKGDTFMNSTIDNPPNTLSATSLFGSAIQTDSPGTEHDAELEDMEASDDSVSPSKENEQPPSSTVTSPPIEANANNKCSNVGVPRILGTLQAQGAGFRPPTTQPKPLPRLHCRPPMVTLSRALPRPFVHSHVIPLAHNDPEHAYGLHVAAMLRSFSPKKKQLAKMKIEKLLFEVQFGEDVVA